MNLRALGVFRAVAASGSQAIRPFRPMVWQKFAAVLAETARGPAVDGFVKALRAAASAYRRGAARGR